jgi:hypothetical protein
MSSWLVLRLFMAMVPWRYALSGSTPMWTCHADIKAYGRAQTQRYCWHMLGPHSHRVPFNRCVAENYLCTVLSKSQLDLEALCWCKRRW